MGIPAADRDDDSAVLALLPLVRRVIAARVHDPQVVDDLVQETIARLLQAHPRLDDQALAPFAVVVARNVAVSFIRSERTAGRHLHRLLDPRAPEQPEEQALRGEEAQAVSAGLARMPAPTALRWSPTRSRAPTRRPSPTSSDRHLARWPPSWPAHAHDYAWTTCWRCVGSTCPATAADRC